jgi:hypothetical protein
VHLCPNGYLSQSPYGRNWQYRQDNINDNVRDEAQLHNCLSGRPACALALHGVRCVVLGVAATEQDEPELGYIHQRNKRNSL